jgi:hypothetical protein
VLLDPLVAVDVKSGSVWVLICWKISRKALSGLHLFNRVKAAATIQGGMPQIKRVIAFRIGSQLRP